MPAAALKAIARRLYEVGRVKDYSISDAKGALVNLALSHSMEHEAWHTILDMGIDEAAECVASEYRQLYQRSVR